DSICYSERRGAYSDAYSVSIEVGRLNLRQCLTGSTLVGVFVNRPIVIWMVLEVYRDRFALTKVLAGPYYSGCGIDAFDTRNGVKCLIFVSGAFHVSEYLVASSIIVRHLASGARVEAFCVSCFAQDGRAAFWLYAVLYVIYRRVRQAPSVNPNSINVA